MYFFSQYNEFNRENVRDFVDGSGLWAPLAYFLVFIVASPVPFIGPIITAAGGLLFGVVRGTLYTVLSTTFASLVPFWIARSLGQEWVEEQVDGGRIEQIYQQSEGHSGFVFILVLRLVPVVPWEIQNYIAGLTKISVPLFLLASFVGLMPGTFAYTFLGSAAPEPGSWQFIAAVALVIITKVIVPVVVTYTQNHKMNNKEESNE